VRLQKHFGNRRRAAAVAVDLENVVAIVQQIALDKILYLQTELMIRSGAIEVSPVSGVTRTVSVTPPAALLVKCPTMTESGKLAKYSLL
jgi:hypothetical protein